MPTELGIPDELGIPEDWPGARRTATGTRLGPERRAHVRPPSGRTELPPRPVPVLDDAPEPSDGDPSARPVEAAGDDVDLLIEIEGGATTLFEAAIDAYHAGEYARAESLFLEEAARATDEAPQRSAIAYRQAALAAGKAGNHDGSDHWMRLAGREYLRVTEDVRTPLPFIREAALMAAKCFLSVENVHVANKGLRRAQAIESVLRADDDLSAASTGIPFRHETADVAPDDDAPTGQPSTGEGRLRRLRDRLAGRSAA